MNISIHLLLAEKRILVCVFCYGKINMNIQHLNK